MRAVIVLGLAISGSPAFAQDLSGYTGVAVGVFEYRNETGGAFSQSVSSWKLYGAFQLGNHVSLEFGREWPSAIEVDDPGSPLTIATRRLTLTHRVDFELTTFRAMGRLPFRRFDLWLAYGSYSMDADVDFDFTLNSITRSTSLNVDESGELLGVGVDWKLGSVDRPFDVRLEYEQRNFSFSDAATVAVGVAYRFGGG